MEFTDRQLTCLDCGQPFVFTAGEQEFYQRKGFKEEPKRCKTCREARKTRRQGQVPEPYGARNGNGVETPDDIGNRTGGRDAGPRRGTGREMFEAVCAQCGSATRVPFKPTPGRPVYCRDCYSARGRGVG